MEFFIRTNPTRINEFLCQGRNHAVFKIRLWTPSAGCADSSQVVVGFAMIPAVLVGVVWIYQLIWASRFRPILESRAARIAAFAAMAVLFLFLGSGANSQFIYQQF